MDDAIQLFSNDEFGTIRATVIDEEPWFVASDVASALEYGAAAKLTRNLFDDEKGVHIVDTPGGNQQVSVISLGGLFHAMNMRRTGVIKNKGNRERVERFQRWVNHDSETFDHYGCLTPKGLDWCKRRYCDQHMFDF